MKKKIAIALVAAGLLAAPSFSQTSTPNIGLTIIPTGQQNWGPTVNLNWNKIDTAVGNLQNAYQGAWSSTFNYSKGMIATYSNAAYISTINNNLNHVPGTDSTWGLLAASNTNPIIPNPGAAGFAPVSNGTIYTSQQVLLASQVGLANGVAGLDGNIKIPFSYIPASSTADGYLATTTANTLAWNVIPNCGSSQTSTAMGYSVSSHGFICNPIAIMGGSGVSHAAGFVPDPGATSGSTRFLNENGSWVTPPAFSGASAGGDLSGTYPNPTVAKVNGNPFRSTTPTNIHQVATWDGGGYGPRQLSYDDLLPAFTISTFTCDKSGTYEIGQTVSSPTTCTAAYTSPATSANIADGTHTVNLTSPFTSGVMPYSYTMSSQGTITLTLTAVSGSITAPTRSVAMNFWPRSFGGTGTTIATSCTASGNNCTVTGGTLTDAGLVTSVVNKVFGPYSPVSNQRITIVVPGGCTHSSWVDNNNSGIAFAMDSGTAFTLTNQYGGSVPSCAYNSSNTYLGGSFAPKPIN